MSRPLQQFKVCRGCGVLKARAEFHKKGPWVTSHCKPCNCIKVASERARYPENRDPEKLRVWRQGDYLRRKDKILDERREWYIRQGKYSPKMKQRNLARHARKVGASIGGLFREETQRIYDACPPGHEVDHIVPIKGKKVCGLHVPWNLQYLPRAENRSKNNRFDSENMRA